VNKFTTRMVKNATRGSF